LYCSFRFRQLLSIIIHRTMSRSHAAQRSSRAFAMLLTAGLVITVNGQVMRGLDTCSCQTTVTLKSPADNVNIDLSSSTPISQDAAVAANPSEYVAVTATGSSCGTVNLNVAVKTVTITPVSVPATDNAALNFLSGQSFSASGATVSVNNGVIVASAASNTVTLGQMLTAITSTNYAAAGAAMNQQAQSFLAGLSSQEKQAVANGKRTLSITFTDANGCVSAPTQVSFTVSGASTVLPSYSSASTAGLAVGAIMLAGVAAVMAA